MKDRATDKLPRTDLMNALRDGRDGEMTIKQHFLGNFDREEFTDKERDMYNRVVSLRATVSRITGRLERNKILDTHCETFGISLATASRDWRMLNKIEGEFRNAELELERAQLYKIAWNNIELAEAAKDSRAISTALKVAKEIIGLDTEGGKSLVSPDKIEQHINIIVSSSNTEKILAEMVKNDMSVNKWNMTLDDILREESTPRTIDIEHEEIESD